MNVLEVLIDVTLVQLATTFKEVTADCKKSCNKQAEQWQTTIYLFCEGHAEAGKVIRFIRGKSIVVCHCSACVLQDFLQSAVHVHALATVHTCNGFTCMGKLKYLQ